MMRGDLERAGPPVACAEEAQAALDTQHLGVLAAASALAFFRGDVEQARHLAELRLEQARASGDTHKVAHALLQLAAALFDDPGRGTAVAEEAVCVAREAGLSSVLPDALAVYLVFVGPEDPARELALLEEVIEVATALGDHRLVATTVAARESNKARQGDWPAALRGNAEAAAPYRDGGNMTVVVPTLRSAGIALTALRRFEAAAVILGFADAHLVRPRRGEYMTYLTAAETALLDALGEQRLAELQARGATLAFTDAIDYLCAEADRALE
jgi:hypothetical protein